MVTLIDSVQNKELTLRMTLLSLSLLALPHPLGMYLLMLSGHWKVYTWESSYWYTPLKDVPTNAVWPLKGVQLVEQLYIVQ